MCSFRLSGRAFPGTLGVQFDVMQPWSRYVVFVENGIDRALGNTGFTVDAPFWMDVDHVGVLVKALGWANPQARLVFAAFAWFGYDHRHSGDPRVRIISSSVGTNGGENLNDKADNDFQNFSDATLTNLASRELVDLWQSGSQEAARVLLARYEVRLIALVASRINRKYRSQILPNDVVQSAMGSFFRATRAGTNPSIKLESTASAWNILATFARRKLSRALNARLRPSEAVARLECRWMIWNRMQPLILQAPRRTRCWQIFVRCSTKTNGNC